MDFVMDFAAGSEGVIRQRPCREKNLDCLVRLDSVETVDVSKDMHTPRVKPDASSDPGQASG
jgi:hypothetical protein